MSSFPAIQIVFYRSPLGWLRVEGDEKHIHTVRFVSHLGRGVLNPSPLMKSAVKQLDEYFRGKRRSFDLPLKWQGTAFQQKVWRALTKIPYGKTRSYSQVAATIDNPRAARAIGTACGRNSLWIVVPCHRVVGAGGTLGGYAGGVKRKRALLTHEGSMGSSWRERETSKLISVDAE